MNSGRHPGKVKAVREEYTFSVVLEPLDEGGFLVLVPALPEVVTHGDTEQQALAMAEDAIRLVVGYRRDHGGPIPVEKGARLRNVKVALPA
jgi:antitoxin HicB